MTEVADSAIRSQLNVRGLVRPVVRDIPGYLPAKSAAKLPDRVIRLDMNESPYGPSPRTRAALLDFAETNRYPDFAQTRLRTALSSYTGVAVEQIVCGAGLDDVFSALANLVIDAGDEVIISEPTFGVYRPLFTLHCAKVVNILLTSDFDLDPSQILAGVTERTKLIIVCSPNNPTGNLFPLAAVEEVCARASCLVAIDEAYVEFSGQSHIPLMDRFPNLAVFRTMSKWAGLAGMRVGYGLFPAALAPHLASVTPPFHNVSLASAEAAVASLEDRDVLMEQVGVICANRDRLFADLSATEGLRPLPSVTNFVLVQTELDDARPLIARIAERGVLVRGYGDDVLRSTFRVTVGTPDENAAFLTALRDSLEETPA